MSKFIKIVLIVIFVGVIAYAGTCAYANFFAFDGGGKVKLPKFQDAQYSVTIENTGNVLFTNKYDTYGKVYILHGFWELSGKSFAYRDRDLVLDEKIFGTITIKIRPTNETKR